MMTDGLLSLVQDGDTCWGDGGCGVNLLVMLATRKRFLKALGSIMSASIHLI
jgi:hypothetical protein